MNASSRWAEGRPACGCAVHSAMPAPIEITGGVLAQEAMALFPPRP
jgi:hypothetical protein